jgi:hypothetical protein
MRNTYFGHGVSSFLRVFSILMSLVLIKVLMTKFAMYKLAMTGPNDASHVVWELGE